MSILLTICARGGSKGIPRKNLRELAGKPLIVHTIQQALEWNGADRVIVSTDNEEIAEVSRNHGADVPFLRPAELASDEADKLSVLKHAVKYLQNHEGEEFDFIVDLDPTSPLRTINDIERCFQACQDSAVNNVFSICEADKNPYFNMVELDSDGYTHLSKTLSTEVTRRQDAPDVYEMNASIYVYRTRFLLESESIHSERTRGVIMPRERSIDIDHPVDLKLVELLMEERQNLDQ